MKYLFLELSNICNLKCIFCDNRLNPKKEFITLDDFKDIDRLIDMVPDDGYIDLTGRSEFLMHPKLDKILDRVKHKRLRLVTNGTLLGPAMRNKLSKLKWAEFIISLNSLNPETYEKLNGVGFKLETTMGNFIKFREKVPCTSLSFVINNHNFTELDNIVDFSLTHDVPVSMLGLTPVLNDLYTEDLLILPTEENKIIVKTLQTKINIEGTKASLFNFNSQEKEDRGTYFDDHVVENGCHWLDDFFFINMDAAVKPCCWNDTIMGNIKEQTYEEIINGEKYRELRKNIYEGVIGSCGSCRGWG